eukprot:755587-Hanusia_phi.AAC.14
MAEEVVQNPGLPVGGSQVQRGPPVPVSRVRVGSVPDQRSQLCHVTLGCSRAELHSDVHPQQLPACLPEYVLDVGVTVDERVAQRRPSQPVTAVDVRGLGEQVLHHLLVPLARRQVQRRPQVVVGLVDVDPVGDQPLDVLQLPVEGMIAE